MGFPCVRPVAKKQGRLIFAMRQSRTDIMCTPGPWGGAYRGCCAGCAIHWIALRYGESDFAYDSQTQWVEMPDWRVTRNQNVYLNEYDKTAADLHFDEFPDVLTPAFAPYGLLLNKGRVTKRQSAATGSILRGAGIAGIGCYYISLAGEPSSHAVAMQNEGARGWRFFDANYGCFSATSDQDFQEFIDWYMRETEYEKMFSKFVKIVGINPPPYVLGGFGPGVENLIKPFEG
jgi:hypothetical protein